jgi:hypothetical protein
MGRAGKGHTQGHENGQELNRHHGGEGLSESPIQVSLS